MDFIKNYFKGKTIAFYVALGTAALSLITAIIYAAAFGGDPDYMSWLGFVLILLGAAAFVTLSVFKQTRLGIAAMAVLDFFGVVAAIVGTYGYFVSFLIGGGIYEALGDSAAVAFIVCLVLLILCCIAGNVTAWLRLQKDENIATGN